MNEQDVIATEDFIQHAVTKTEVHALKWALKLWDKPGGKPAIEQYVAELEEELEHESPN